MALRRLWRERILGRYLRGEISREEAIQAVGIDWVEMAERQRQAVIETAVVDAGPLIHLNEVKALHLLLLRRSGAR